MKKHFLGIILIVIATSASPYAHAKPHISMRLVVPRNGYVTCEAQTTSNAPIMLRTQILGRGKSDLTQWGYGNRESPLNRNDNLYHALEHSASGHPNARTCLVTFDRNIDSRNVFVVLTSIDEDGNPVSVEYFFNDRVIRD